MTYSPNRADWHTTSDSVTIWIDTPTRATATAEVRQVAAGLYTSKRLGRYGGYDVATGTNHTTFAAAVMDIPSNRIADADASDRAAVAPNRVTDAATRTDADALRDTANHHQGSRVHAADADHQRQLRRSGLVGRRGGLTRKGSIVAEGLRNATLDDAFGPA